MKRFKNILYIINNSSIEQNFIAERVADLARMNEAKVTVMISSENSFAESITLPWTNHREEILQALHDQQKEELDTFLSHERWEQLPVASYIPKETDFITIIKKVIDDEHDLVIKEEDRTEGIGQLAMRLVRKCPSPVWIIKKQTSEFTQIMGAVDVGSDLAETERLNQKVLELTHSLAQRENGEAHYLHVWRLEYESWLRGSRFKVEDEEIEEMKENLYKDRLNRLQTLLNKIHIHPKNDHIYLKEGKIVEAINELIAELNIDVLVMGSVGRSGIPGFFIGNKAETLLSNIHCTVLTVKPDGFISPITSD